MGLKTSKINLPSSPNQLGRSSVSLKIGKLEPPLIGAIRIPAQAAVEETWCIAKIPSNQSTFTTGTRQAPDQRCVSCGLELGPHLYRSCVFIYLPLLVSTVCPSSRTSFIGFTPQHALCTVPTFRSHIDCHELPSRQQHNNIACHPPRQSLPQDPEPIRQDGQPESHCLHHLRQGEDQVRQSSALLFSLYRKGPCLRATVDSPHIRQQLPQRKETSGHPEAVPHSAVGTQHEPPQLATECPTLRQACDCTVNFTDGLPYGRQAWSPARPLQLHASAHTLHPSDHQRVLFILKQPRAEHGTLLPADEQERLPRCGQPHCSWDARVVLQRQLLDTGPLRLVHEYASLVR
jgi:hypothetical protein